MFARLFLSAGTLLLGMAGETSATAPLSAISAPPRDSVQVVAADTTPPSDPAPASVAPLGPALPADYAAPAASPPGPPAPGADAKKGKAAKDDELAKVRLEIAATERLLASVQKKVGRSFSRKARADLQEALLRQREARQALDGALYARADRLTLEARKMAGDIAVHLGPPQNDPDYVATILDRTDDAIKRAREVLQEGGGDAEIRRIEALEERQLAARELFKGGTYQRAYVATQEVRDAVLELLRSCDDLPVSASTAEKALKRAARTLDRAASELGEKMTAGAERLEREARAQLAKARTAFARKNYRDTLLHAKLVERNVDLAVAAQRGATSRSG